jgi:hypothetical protein
MLQENSPFGHDPRADVDTLGWRIVEVIQRQVGVVGAEQASNPPSCNAVEIDTVHCVLTGREGGLSLWIRSPT